MNPLLLSLLIISVSFGLSIGFVDGGTNIIEFKKKYVTNSPDVCGDRLCDETVSRYDLKKNRHTPMGQYKDGIPIYKITCKSHLQFVVKLSNWHPACVKAENVQKLVEIGWAATPEEHNKIFTATQTKEIPKLKPLEEYRKEYPIYEGLGLTITPETIQGKSYLIFDGYGWHRYHNVEVTISNDLGEREFFMSQTSPRGELYVPWPIPETISGGWYHVFATDGIHDYEIEIPITAQES